ncbi:Nitrilotriacetate monooxygenase component A/pristinamycin IIA synthase subunit A [Hypoxylon trugodes]|uniref:Nitrilotriacetate monooxygenase component A/pristinamycin IIA synthase subunit A n=1 Tax=Hypoxylon trugodes TaxID=326681 RepID=UPI0021A12702|nr:Nitrilotriacetate monooxygenase component A/pristinamycin IIA synthase subunit A [Hypoxylon trugodes]KAI1390529.1 Nitrilotriacetate monooxygenase component A/pristinamycin IIA synthase subunit A [Hypoxylon trugodes]
MASSENTGAAAPQPKKQFLLNAFVMTTPGHLSPGLWKHPRNRTDEYNKLSFWIELAQLLDKGGFHAMFIADVLGAYDVYRGPANVDPVLSSGAQFPVNDPLYTVPAMAAATKNLIFGVTASTTYDAPYAMARRFSTVDHLAEGRVAWNIVTSYLESAARNFGLETQIEHDERYRIAEEYMEVLYKLWESSWRDDAVVRDREKGLFAVAGRVRPIGHQGKYFKVPGPHIAEPSPQRTPFLFQAGTSKAGAEFGGKHAEAVFVGGQLPELVRKSVDNLRESARQFGRDPQHLKILTGITLIVDETDEKAQAKYRELLSYGDREGALALFGGWTGNDLSGYGDDEDLVLVDKPAIRSIISRWSSTVPGTEGLTWTKNRIAEFLTVGGMMPKIIGSPKTIVDELERWAEIADVDGFNLAHVVNPGSFEDIIEFVIPELRRRGLFRTEVEREGVTARDVFFGQPHLLSDHPGHQYKWPAPEEA